MYENTGPRAHEMAADLIEAGVDVHAIYRRLFEGVPQGKLELLARGLSQRRALRRRAAHGHPPDARRLRRHRRRRELLRGRRRPPARAAGHGDGGPRARPAQRRPLRAAAAQGLAARHRRPRRRLGDRARPGRRRAPPRRGLLDLDGVPAARRVPARAAWPSSCPEPPTGSSSSTSRRGSRPTTSWRACAGAWAAASRSATRARWTRSRPGCCSCWSAARRACSAS